MAAKTTRELREIHQSDDAAKMSPEEIRDMDDNGLMDMRDDPMPGEQRKLILRD